MNKASSQPLEFLQGQIERVTYANEENSYTNIQRSQRLRCRLEGPFIVSDLPKTGCSRPSKQALQERVDAIEKRFDLG